jgi:hypothetical protein
MPVESSTGAHREEPELVVAAAERGYFRTRSEGVIAELAAEFGVPQAEIKRRLASEMARLLTENGTLPEGGGEQLQFPDETVR